MKYRSFLVVLCAVFMAVTSGYFWMVIARLFWFDATDFSGTSAIKCFICDSGTNGTSNCGDPFDKGQTAILLDCSAWCKAKGGNFIDAITTSSNPRPVECPAAFNSCRKIKQSSKFFCCLSPCKAVVPEFTKNSFSARISTFSRAVVGRRNWRCKS